MQQNIVTDRHPNRQLFFSMFKFRKQQFNKLLNQYLLACLITFEFNKPLL